jgi:hypothetical protein
MLSIRSIGDMPGQVYYFQVLIAVGVGGNFAVLLVMNPHAVEKKYMGKTNPHRAVNSS